VPASEQRNLTPFVFCAPTIAEKISSAATFVNDQSKEVVRDAIRMREFYSDRRTSGT
jgi:hypothetical protein